MEHRSEEVLDLVVAAQDQRNPNPSADHRENRKDRERNPHHWRRFMHAMRMSGLSAAMLRLRDHRCVRVTVGMDRSEVVIMTAMSVSESGFIEARSTKEGLEPQPEHVEARETSGDQADEP